MLVKDNCTEARKVSFFLINNQFKMGGKWGNSVKNGAAERELCFQLELCAEMALVLDDRGYLLGCLVWVSEQALAGCQISLL